MFCKICRSSSMEFTCRSINWIFICRAPVAPGLPDFQANLLAIFVAQLCESIAQTFDHCGKRTTWLDNADPISLSRLLRLSDSCAPYEQDENCKKLCPF